MQSNNFPIDDVRAQFPALNFKNHEQVFPIYFDGPGGTQMVQGCIDRILEYIETGMANLHGTFSTSIKTDDLLAEAKKAVGDLLNCPAEEIAFGQNMTSLAFQVSHSLRPLLKEGDEILVTQLDHRANVDPWIHLASETGASLRWIPVDKEKLVLDLTNLDSLINPKTKVVAVGLSSNLTGTVNDAKRIFKAAKKVNAITIADAVHAVPHFLINKQELGSDVLFCSAYKFFGPHLGIAAIKKALFEQLEIPKLQPAPNEIPYKLETGTQNHEAIAGLCGSISFIESLGSGANRRERLRSGMEAIETHELELVASLQQFLKSVPEVRLYRAAEEVPKTPTFAFRIDGIHSRQATKFFAEKFNLCIADGHFYASTMAEIFPVMETGGWIRIGFAPYNTMDEIEIFKKALRELLQRKT
ncbi:cysteine desulfurase-like protein [Salinimicrobium xinjiangense]|uniref:cysteine desulfurase-like protein n=1 Tax=Salinimicrobium xinjiangense TaxID=438596 RepID=UPI00040CFC66|nr:cysteine desulfurase-like protein [Salinimicrobium xinjiangense]